MTARGKGKEGVCIYSHCPELSKLRGQDFCIHVRKWFLFKAKQSSRIGRIFLGKPWWPEGHQCWQKGAGLSLGGRWKKPWLQFLACSGDDQSTRFSMQPAHPLQMLAAGCSGHWRSQPKLVPGSRSWRPSQREKAEEIYFGACIKQHHQSWSAGISQTVMRSQRRRGGFPAPCPLWSLLTVYTIAMCWI